MNKYRIIDYIKSHPFLYYVSLCAYEAKNLNFRDYVIGYKENPRIIEFKDLGDKNEDKEFYSITVGDNAVGMASLCTWTLRRLEFADKFHLLPYVRWTKNVVYAKDGGINGRSNPFEYFFKQPTNLSFEEIEQSKNVAFARHSDRAYGSTAFSYDFSDEEAERLSKIWAKYINFQPELEEEIRDEINSLFGDYKILGIHMRGADWRKMKVSGHPITASEEEYIAEAKSAMEKYGFKKIFLATDSEESLDKFKTVFKDKLLYHKNIARTPADSESLVIFDKEKDHYRLGVEILLDTMSLAYSHGFIAGISYVSYLVRIIKLSRAEKFEYLKLINKGLQDKNGIDYKKAAQKQKKVLEKR